MTAPATVRALGQRWGRDQLAHRRSQGTQRSTVCPGPSARPLANPRTQEHTRGLPVLVSTPASPVARRRLPAAPLFTLSKGRGRASPELAEGIGRLRPNSVRSLPVVRPRPATRVDALPLPGPPLFTLSKGRGRASPELAEGIGRPRPNSVRSLPRTPSPEPPVPQCTCCSRRSSYPLH